jgi:hypothetical protein
MIADDGSEGGSLDTSRYRIMLRRCRPTVVRRSRTSWLARRSR